MPRIVPAAAGPAHPGSGANTARRRTITVNGCVAATNDCRLLPPAQQ